MTPVYNLWNDAYPVDSHTSTDEIAEMKKLLLTDDKNIEITIG